MTAADFLPLLLSVLLGREIYERGTSNGAEIRATMSGSEVSASILPCASCHGADGRGRAEGGTVPSDIRHATLTRPYDVSAPSGRKHGPYDERALVRAIAMGVDPAGNALSEVMPRYQLSRNDAAALIAFLETLGTHRDPGVAEDALIIGVLGGALPDARDEVFGRRLEFRAATSLTEDAFAFVTDNASPELAEEADRLGVPVISLLSPKPVIAKHVFHLFGGIDEQQRVLSREPANGRRLVPAALASPETFRESSTVAFVMLPSASPPRAQAALAATALLVDALRRAGRDVSRASFLEALENTSQLRSDYAPPLTFSATRRIGSTGAYLVDFDEGRAGVPRWVD